MRRMMRSMRFRIVLLVSGTALCLMAFSLLFFHVTFTGRQRESAGENLEALANQTVQTLDYSLSMLENTMTYFFSNQTLQDWFKGGEAKTADAAGQLVSQIQLDDSLRHTLMLNSAWQNNLMDSAFFIVDKRCFSFYSQGKLPVFELTQRSFSVYDQVLQNEGTGLLAYPPARGEPLFYLAKRYPEIRDAAISLVLILCVDEDTLMKGYEKALQYPGTVACIVGADGTVYSSADKSLLGSQVGPQVRQLMSAGDFCELAVDGEPYYALSQRISTTGLSFVAGVPRRSVDAYAQSVSFQYLQILLLVFAGFLMLTILVSYRSTRFLKRITHSLNKIKQGNYRERMPAYATTELAELSGTFNEMSGKIDYLIHEVYEKQLAVKRADIKYLQSQIHPHFLFNALAAISTKAKLAKEESIYAMVRSVSTLLSAGITNDGDALISVAQELEYIDCYLYIQKQRFGEKLSYTIHVEYERLKAALIPRLCVEPIVENAVIHGLEVKPARGSVALAVGVDGDDLLFVVTDDGVGFGDANPLADGRQEEAHESIGLRNTHRRLQLIYGERYGVFIDRQWQTGARVTVRIPYRKEA